jgi:hypothetical protein
MLPQNPKNGAIVISGETRKDLVAYYDIVKLFRLHFIKSFYLTMNTTRLRLPFFLLALFVIAALMLIEFGSTTATQLFRFPQPDQNAVFEQGLKIFSKDQVDELNRQMASPEIPRLSENIQGFGIPSMRFVDGCLLFTSLLMGLALLIPTDKHSRIQGVITLVFGIVLIIVAIAWIFAVLVKLLFMVALLLSFPFGTIAYLLVYGSFPRASMNVILSMLFLLKIIFVVLLLLAHQGFLKNIGLVVFVAVSFVAGLVVSFLYGLVPGVLVSITDAIAALVVTIAGIMLGLILAIGSIPSILKAIKV